MRVSRIFHEIFKGLSRVFQNNFKNFSKVFQERLKLLLGCFKVFMLLKVHCCMSLIAATWAEGGLVSALKRPMVCLLSILSKFLLENICDNFLRAGLEIFRPFCNHLGTHKSPKNHSFPSRTKIFLVLTELMVWSQLRWSQLVVWLSRII